MANNEMFTIKVTSDGYDIKNAIYDISLTEIYKEELIIFLCVSNYDIDNTIDLIISTYGAEDFLRPELSLRGIAYNLEDEEIILRFRNFDLIFNCPKHIGYNRNKLIDYILKD